MPDRCYECDAPVPGGEICDPCWGAEVMDGFYRGLGFPVVTPKDEDPVLVRELREEDYPF